MKQSHHNIPFLAGGGEMGALMREKDWQKTPLGSPENWPQSLRTTLSIILNSKFPMFLFWGPELICFYNDAYRPSLGNAGKHPKILGEKGAECWPETWPIIKPIIDKVLSGGEASWSEDQLIPIYRNGEIEDAYWTFSYSPVQDESGKPAGVFVTCTETTAKVVTIKRLAESEERFRTMAEGSDIMIAMSDESGNATYFNHAWTKLTGRSAETLEDFGWADLIHPDDRQEILDLYFNAFAKRESLIGEFRIANKAGNYSWLLVKGVPRFGQDGLFAGYISSSADITQTKESEKRLRDVADSAPVLIWMADQNKHGYFFNKAWQEFTGRSLKEEMEGDWGYGVHPDDVARCEMLYTNAFNRQEAFYTEHRRMRYDGMYRWLSVNGVPRFSTEGVFEGYIGACMDIHEQFLVQKKLKEDEERLNIVIEASELGTWELNLKTSEVYYSDRYLEILGYKAPIDLAHTEILKHLHPDDLPIRQAAFQRSLETGFLHYASRIIWNDKSVHWIEGKGKVFYDEHNQPLKMLGTVRDITEEKNFQQQLQEREQKFRLLAQTLPHFVWTGDAAGNLNYFNQTVYDYSGLSPEQVQKEGWLQIVHPDEREENIQTWINAVTTGNDFVFEHRFRRHDGQYRWQLSRAVPQKDEAGNIQMWVGTSTDIQEQKMFTQELERQVQERTGLLQESYAKLEASVEELQKMNAELQSFAYVSSHDLQEPLRKIQTFIGRILDKESMNLSETGKDYFQRTQAAAKRMQVLIEDLLAYSRTNSTDRIFKNTDLHEIIAEVKNEFKETIVEKRAVIEIGEMCPANVIPFQFRQLFHNLLGNALKFSKPDTAPHIHIQSRIVPRNQLILNHLPPEKRYCHVSFSDNGIGFDPQYKDRIFEVFQRLHGKNEYKGTGIGLAIVKKIIENHGGAIEANSELGHGARFDIYIPAD